MGYTGFRIKNEGVLLALAWRDFLDTLTYYKKKKSKSQNQSPTRYSHFMEKHMILCRKVSYKLIAWLCINICDSMNTLVFVFIHTHIYTHTEIYTGDTPIHTWRDI